MSDIVVNLSGVLNVEDMEGKTADQIINLALSVWNVPKESIDSPFVTIHSRSSNKYRPLQGDEVMGKVDPENDVVRVILPLKTGSVEANDKKQYLVE